MAAAGDPILASWLDLAARPDPVAVVAEAAALARRTVDWTAVETVVGDQALLPALRRLLLALPADAVPEPVLGSLAAMWRGRVAWSAVAVAELERVVEAFAEQGIRTIVLKGPALAVQLYGDAAARPYGDLDLLVDPDRRVGAARVLDRLGYAGDAARPAGPDSFLRLRRSVAWPGPRGVDVDLHWGFDEGGLRLDLGRRGVFARAASVTVGERRVLALGDVDQLLYLSVHGAKHLWQRRLWLSDLARFVHVRPALDWDAVVGLARRTGASRILASALLLAERLAGARPPDDVLAWARARPGARRLADVHATRLARDLSGLLPSEPGASVGPWRWIALDLAQLERPRDKARGLLAWFLEVSDPGWDASAGAPPPRFGRLARVLRYLGRDLARLVPGGGAPPPPEGGA